VGRGVGASFIRLIRFFFIARRASSLALYPGEDVNGMSFHGVDEELLRRALRILVHQGKCEIFNSDNFSEDGIKFIEPKTDHLK
jgi:hypothetical protein